MSIKYNLEHETLENTDFRRVISTNANQQLVVMSLNPREEIGKEKHKKTSQFIRIEQGNGHAIVNGRRYVLKDGVSISVPPNTFHNIIAGSEGLKLYTIYSPPEHAPGTVQRFRP